MTIQTRKRHQDSRKLLRKVFSPQYLAVQIPKIEKITNQYIQKWAKLRNFAWYPELRKYSFDVACKNRNNLNEKEFN